MNTMRIPGFTADLSLHKISEIYKMANYAMDSLELSLVTPQLRIDANNPWCYDDCVSAGASMWTCKYLCDRSPLSRYPRSNWF